MNEGSFFLSLITTVVVTVSSIAAWLIKKQISDVSLALQNLRTDFGNLKDNLFSLVKDHERRIATIEGIIRRNYINGN